MESFIVAVVVFSVASTVYVLHEFNIKPFLANVPLYTPSGSINGNIGQKWVKVQRQFVMRVVSKLKLYFVALNFF